MHFTGGDHSVLSTFLFGKGGSADKFFLRDGFRASGYGEKTDSGHLHSPEQKRTVHTSEKASTALSASASSDRSRTNFSWRGLGSLLLTGS